MGDLILMVIESDMMVSNDGNTAIGRRWMRRGGSYQVKRDGAGVGGWMDRAAAAMGNGLDVDSTGTEKKGSKKKKNNNRNKKLEFADTKNATMNQKCGDLWGC